MTITRTQGENILSRIKEFGDTISDYELNCEGADEKDLRGVPGYIGKLHEFDIHVFREHINTLPCVDVIDVDEVTGQQKQR